MIHIVTAENEYHYRDEMEQAYRLRHQIFVEEMGWTELAKPDGREIDQFDTSMLFICCTLSMERCLAISVCFPRRARICSLKSCPNFARLNAPLALISGSGSRFCVERGRREQGRFRLPIANHASYAAWSNGVWSVESRQLIHRDRPYLAAAYGPASLSSDALGVAAKMGGEDILAVTATFDWRTLNRSA